MTEEKIEALYWDENDRGEKKELILPESAIVLVDPFISFHEKRIQVRIPSSVRAITYDTSFKGDWGFT